MATIEAHDEFLTDEDFESMLKSLKEEIGDEAWNEIELKIKKSIEKSKQSES